MRDRPHQQQDDGIQRHKGNVDQECCSWALQTNKGFDPEVLCDKVAKGCQNARATHLNEEHCVVNNVLDVEWPQQKAQSKVSGLPLGHS